MKLGQHQEQFSRHVVLLLAHAHRSGYEVRIGECERTIEQQQRYVATGRSKTMNSQHLKKCAIDLHFFKDGALCYPAELGAFWEKLDPLNRWGGNFSTFKDGPHFERRA